MKSEDVKKSLRQTNDQRFRLYYLLDVSDIANFAEEVISLTPLLSEKIDELKEIFNDDITDQDEYISFAIDELNDKVECIQNNIMDSIQSNVMSICDGSMLSNESQIYKYISFEKEDFIKKCKNIIKKY